MRRGEIWTGKPGPDVIPQNDSFDATNSVTICAFTTDEADAQLIRLSVEPNERNGLREVCRPQNPSQRRKPRTWPPAQNSASAAAQSGRLLEERKRGQVLENPGLAQHFAAFVQMEPDIDGDLRAGREVEHRAPGIRAHDGVDGLALDET